MILLTPNVINHQISVFVKNKVSVYNAVLTNQSTKQSDNFNINLPSSKFEGELIFTLPVIPEKGTFYTLILHGDNVRSHYSVCYCDDNLTQQFSRLDDDFVQAGKEAVMYKMPKK